MSRQDQCQGDDYIQSLLNVIHIFLKVVGGGSTCAEKVPWNVLIELVSGPKLKASGETMIRENKNTHYIKSTLIRFPNNTTHRLLYQV